MLHIFLFDMYILEHSLQHIKTMINILVMVYSISWVLVCVSALPAYILIRKVAGSILLCWNSSTLDKINSFCIHFHISIMFIWISYSEIYEPIIIPVVVNENFNCYANATFPVVSTVICAVAQSVHIMKYVLPFSCILHEILLSKFRWSSSIHFMDEWLYTHVCVWCNYLSIQLSLRRFC